MGMKKIRLHEKRAVETANESVFPKALLNALHKHTLWWYQIRSERVPDRGWTSSCEAELTFQFP